MKVTRSENPKQEASDALAKIFKEYRDVPVLFLTSGGSALSLLTPEILPENPQMTISVLDEHYVADPNERNFEKLKKTEFFRNTNYEQRYESTKNGRPVFLDFYGGEVEEAGKRFDAFLKKWVADNPTGKIVVTAGMGADGHTAGIVPFSDADSFQKLFMNPNALAVGYKTSYGPFPERVTATVSLISKASDVILYAMGKEKAETIRTFLEEDKPLHTFPAMFLKTLPNVQFFTDQNSN